MSIFGSILQKIMGHGAAAQPSQPAEAAAQGGSPPPPGPQGDAPTSQAAQKPAQQVDVAAVLENLAQQNPQKLDWRHSIVDLMKLLGLDSSLQHRQQLAQELHYSGDPGDSAAMNIWLHKQVMQKLAENGGQVPADLRS